MNVRNFWIEVQIDGKKEKLASGPRSKDGGFSLVVKMRKDGQITQPVIIEGYATDDGKLVLLAKTPSGTQNVTTER